MAEQSNSIVAISRALESRADTIRAALPTGVPLTVDRIRVSAMLAIRKSEELQRCDPASVLESVVQAAQLGVDPGGALGEGYLVPYKGRCQLILGYQGMISIARRSGEVRTLEAQVVCEGDDFDFQLGSGAFLRHRFDVFAPRGQLRGVWAKAVLSDGSEQYEVMSIGEIDAIRGRSKAGSSGPWKTDYPEMAKKTVIRRLFKRLPKSLALLEAIEHDNDTAGVVETVAPPPSRGLGGLRVAGAERGPVVDVQPEAASEPEPAPSFDVEAMRLRCVDALQAVYAPEEAAYGAIGKEIADAAKAGDVQALRGVLAVINQRANQE